MKSFKDLIKLVDGQPPRKMIVAAAEDTHVLEAVCKAYDEDIIEPILVGQKEKIKQISDKIKFDLNNIEIVEEDNPVNACIKSVSLIKEGKADILMKGLVGTADILRTVLDKDKGLKKSELLSHVSVFESPYYHKLLGASDVAMNISPDLKEKAGIINNSVEVFRAIGINNPKVAIVCPVELVNPALQATLDAAELTVMNKRKQIKNCIVDGPLGFDNAISKEAAELKGIESDVAGEADILICHDINSGNVLYKALGFLGGAKIAAVIMGASVPIVLTSRADSEENKHMSIVLAAAL